MAVNGKGKSQRMKFGVSWPLSTGWARILPWHWNGIWNCYNGWTCWVSTKPTSESTTRPAGRPLPRPRCSSPPPPSAPETSGWAPALSGLPYHHPLMVANRMVLLDHLTKGRVILGVGPGALASDALMLGIDPARQREMMDESLGIILRLFTETDPITYKSDWFELNEAILQPRPYQQPHLPVAVASVQSPAGVTWPASTARRCCP